MIMRLSFDKNKFRSSFMNQRHLTIDQTVLIDYVSPKVCDTLYMDIKVPKGMDQKSVFMTYVEIEFQVTFRIKERTHYLTQTSGTVSLDLVLFI